MIKVDAGAGDNIEDTFKEMRRIARTLNVMVTSEFNEVYLYVHPDDDIDKLLMRWYWALEKGLKVLPIRNTRWD